LIVTPARLKHAASVRGGHVVIAALGREAGRTIISFRDAGVACSETKDVISKNAAV
jgi:hypothetical protein